MISKQLLLGKSQMEPLEIEIKVKINDINYINNILQNIIKADFIKEKQQKDTYYNMIKKMK